jgi:RNA recognition motif-containing protein
MRVDRFTFRNDTKCFVELGSEAEATRIIGELNKTELQGKKLIVKPIADHFVWGFSRDFTHKKRPRPFGGRYFYDEGTESVFEAARPLLEGRRLMLQVKTPGWLPKSPISQQKLNTDRILEQYFAKHGAIEHVSELSTFYGDLQPKPRIACFIDFATREGADNAIEKIHNTEIEDRLTWLTRSLPGKWRAEQIGKLAPEVLKRLQESGVMAKDEQLNERGQVNQLTT